jgi:hypothetical protein
VDWGLREGASARKIVAEQTRAQKEMEFENFLGSYWFMNSVGFVKE